jgi:hypothetical protein
MAVGSGVSVGAGRVGVEVITTGLTTGVAVDAGDTPI